MIVRIRFPVGPSRRAAGRKNRQLAALGAIIVQPFALLALLLAAWAIAARLNWTAAFAIQQGLLSHWLVWLAIAVALKGVSILLGRYGKGDGEAMP